MTKGKNATPRSYRLKTVFSRSRDQCAANWCTNFNCSLGLGLPDVVWPAARSARRGCCRPTWKWAWKWAATSGIDGWYPSTVLAKRWERSVSFEPRAGRVSPRQRQARLGFGDGLGLWLSWSGHLLLSGDGLGLGFWIMVLEWGA